MKKLRLLILLLLIFALGALSACSGGDSLDTPRGVRVDYDTLSLVFEPVTGARVYTVRITPEGGSPSLASVSKESFSLESLAPGKYTIEVRAEGSSADSGESRFSSPIEFVREAECGLVFSLISGGGEYEVSGKGSATGAITVPATYRGKPVTSIGENAFFNKTDVTEVTLPDSVKRISPFAFASCSYLTKINLPGGLLSLGESAFSGCRLLSGELRIPDSLSEIPKDAFAYCSSLTGVDFGSGVTYIGESAFTDCQDIARISLPPHLKEIGDFAFAACADVTEVLFNAELKTLGEFVFSKLVSLESVSLPDSLESIGSGAFYYCSALTDITLGEGIREIGASAFVDTPIYGGSATNEIYVGGWFIGLSDPGVPSANIKEGTVGIANNALFGNKNISSVELPDSVEYIGSLAFAGSGLVSAVIGSGVRCIMDQAFSSCEELVSVILGSAEIGSVVIEDSSLESIGDYAFLYCSSLNYIEIPDTVTDIGAYAFRYTGLYDKALTGVVYADDWVVDYNDKIREDVRIVDAVGISRYAFYGCSSLKSVSIMGALKTVCKGAFYNCTALESVSLPNSLSRIEDYTFYGCTSLALRTDLFPRQLSYIGRSAFYMCASSNDSGATDELKIELPIGLSYIGDFAFYGCGYKAEGEDVLDGGGIHISLVGDSLEYIGRSAFSGFSRLKSITALAVGSIGERAFYDCPQLESVEISSRLTVIGRQAFSSCEALGTVVLADSLLVIGELAFAECPALTSLKLGKSLLEIGDSAFLRDTALSEIYLPASLKKIGKEAFRGCDSLASLTLGTELEYIGAHAFYSADKLTLYLADGIGTEGFAERWNSSFCPTVTGVLTVSPEGYLEAINGGGASVFNLFVGGELSAPERDGYILRGYSTDPGSDTPEYTAGELYLAPSGVTLFAIWESAPIEDIGS